jgi:hypothetical protein
VKLEVPSLGSIDWTRLPLFNADRRVAVLLAVAYFIYPHFR